MFERFTEPGIKVVVTAQEEARKIGNNFVGTEQILLGLIAETSGIGGRVLRKYGVTLRLAREEIKRLVGRGSGFVAVEIDLAACWLLALVVGSRGGCICCRCCCSI